MRVTIYLLGSQAKLAKETLRRHGEYEEQPLITPPHDVSWHLYVNLEEDRPAPWLEYVRPLLAASDAPLNARVRSASAVLLVQAYGRIFAVTFGGGFHAIDPALTEPDFGLRVAANSIDPGRITLVDARGLGKGSRNATSRLPTPNEMFALGLLTDEEWIRRFGGHVKIDGFAKTVSGADSLQLNASHFELSRLPDKLRQTLDLHQSEDYKQLFPFLTYFRRETNRETIQQLDDLVCAAMRQRDTEVGFALPDEFNRAPDDYRLSRRRREHRLVELTTEDVYEAIDELDGWRDPLNAIFVDEFDTDGKPMASRVPLRSYVVGTVRRRGAGSVEDYTLTAGAWFRIDQEYVDVVDRYLRDYVVDLTDDVQLPVWDEAFLKQNVEGRYAEDRYNRWAGREKGYVVLDQDLYHGRAGEHVEICDLLTPDKKLICVKRMDGSDKMSHLFQQGSVSAQLIMGNDEYQANLLAKFRSLVPDAQFGSAADWTIVYAIATSKPGDLKRIMYFFSRAALTMHGKSIRSRGFRLAIAKIARR